MEPELQQQIGRKGFDRFGFTKARFGRLEGLSGELTSNQEWRGNLEKIGTLKIQGTIATVHFTDQKVEIQLPNSADMRELRSRCQSIDAGPLPLCRVKRAGGATIQDREVQLEVIFAAQQRLIADVLHFRVHESIMTAANWTGDRERFQEELLKSLLIRAGKGWVLVAHLSGVFSDNSSRASNFIDFLNSDGDKVTCRIQKDFTAGWIEIVGYTPRPRRNDSGSLIIPWDNKRIRLFGLEREPVIDQHRTGGSLAPLEELQQKRSTFIGCWKRYRDLLHEMEKTAYEERKSEVLQFQMGMVDPQDQSCHKIGIMNWSEKRSSWGEVKEKKVYVARHSETLVDEDVRSTATLIEVKMDGSARLRWDKGTPFNNGFIMIASFSADGNSRRVVSAITRLEHGLSACADLVTILNDPTTAAEPKKITPQLKGGLPYDDSQEEAIAKAIGNQSIIAIQGPPGTGKTRVIVGIIKELYQKKRNQASKTGRSPFRILISSAQNVAVFNAVDLLASEGILIDQRLSAMARDDQNNAARIAHLQESGMEVASRIENRMIREPRLMFQAEYADAVTRLLRELAEIEKISSTIEDRLDGLHRLKSTIPLLPGDLSAQIESHEKQLADLIVLNDVPVPNQCERESIGDFLVNFPSIEDIEAQTRQLETLEASFDIIGKSVAYEELKGLIRRHERARRNGESDQMTATFLEIQRRADLVRVEINDQISKMENSPDDNHGATAESVIKSLTDELQRHRQNMENQVGGVLSDWKNSLLEEPGLWSGLLQKYAEIRGATCQMASPPLSSGGIDLEEQYDLVVVDEAARTDPGELLIPLTLGKTILLLGDQKQLPPYIDDLAASKLQAENPSGLELLKEQSFFQELFEALPDSNKVTLNRQYRSHPVIGSAISRAFYDGILDSGPILPAAYAQWAASKIPIWGEFSNHPLCWVNTDARLGTDNCTDLNAKESEIAIQILSRVVSAMGTGEKQIGVITFYRKQLENLRALLEQSIPNYTRFLELDTVDSFQGKEFPLVILLTSRCDTANGRVGFLSLPNRVNVAVSRAQKQLIIIGSRGTLLHDKGGAQPFKKFAAAAGSNMKFVTL